MRLSLVRIALGVALAVIAGCGSSSQRVERPFTARGGVESGPGSGSWGDTYSGPSGNHIGCIPRRRLAVLITVHNRTKHAITLLGVGGPQRFPRVMERVAVQVRLAPPPPTGDAFVSGLRGWNPRKSSPVSIPPGRNAWVQSNFLMRNCALLRTLEPLTVNRSTTLTYRLEGRQGEQVVPAAAASIVLTRGPLHPRVPINQIG